MSGDGSDTSARQDSLAPAGERHGIAFLLNIGDIDTQDALEILPGHTLRRATPPEVEAIKRGLQRTSTSFQPHVDFFWEHRFPHPGGNVEILPEDAWRYFVVAFRGDHVKMHELSRVFLLTEVEPLVGFIMLFGAFINEGIVAETSQLHCALDQMGLNNWRFHSITSATAEGIRQTYDTYCAHDHELIDLRRVCAELAALNGLKYDSPLRFLGYFALLESLLTHPPNPEDRYDSITRQVKRKLTLLNRRFRRPIDYSDFSESDPERIWTKMYSLRSTVAHGGKPDFAKDLRGLRSHTTALKLLRETTRAVARHALEEPQLLVDLREC